MTPLPITNDPNVVLERVYGFLRNDPRRELCFACLCAELTVPPDLLEQALKDLQGAVTAVEHIRAPCAGCGARSIYRLQ